MTDLFYYVENGQLLKVSVKCPFLNLLVRTGIFQKAKINERLFLY